MKPFPIKRFTQVPMKSAKTVLLTSLLLLTKLSYSQSPSNFTWINIESDQKVMPLVRRALHDPSITAIREVGVEDGYALVMTASHEDFRPIPDYDFWTVYNVALDSGESRILADGYGVKIAGWLGPAQNELAITYDNCWECEAGTLFTTLHFVSGVGWRARWTNQSESQKFPLPGALFDNDSSAMDVEGDVAFAILDSPNGTFAAASWIHTHDPSKGTTQDLVARYSIDPVTGTDHVENLQGHAAVVIERAICSKRLAYFEPMSGQDSKSCRAILKNPPPRPAK
jgi:hypothetical protein